MMKRDGWNLNAANLYSSPKSHLYRIRPTVENQDVDKNSARYLTCFAYEKRKENRKEIETQLTSPA